MAPRYARPNLLYALPIASGVYRPETHSLRNAAPGEFAVDSPDHQPVEMVSACAASLCRASTLSATWYSASRSPCCRLPRSPKDFSGLHEIVRGFVPFAICFTMLLTLWYAHYVFFRRYALHDQFTILLNSCLLFVVLFYVYPLKFLSPRCLAKSSVARVPRTSPPRLKSRS